MVIDLSALTETLLGPNASVAVDVGRVGERKDQLAPHPVRACSQSVRLVFHATIRTAAVCDLYACYRFLG